MNCFAGMAVFGERPLDAGQESRLVSIIRRRCGCSPHIQRSRHALLVSADPPPVHRSKACLFAADARLDNAAEIAALVSGRPAEGDGEHIRRIFEAQGERGVAQLLGAFAFAHWDEPTRRLTLARDVFGLKPLFFHRGEDFVAFASMLPDLLAMPEVPRRLDQTLLGSFLALDHRETLRTFYEAIDRVPSRALVEITPTATRLRRYWEPPKSASATRATEADLVHQARALFDRAVHRCIDDLPGIAILTSGGLDSSAIAATVAQMGRPATCYTGVPPEGLDLPLVAWRYLDERPKVEALARMYPRLTARFIAPDAAAAAGPAATETFLRYGLVPRGGAGMGWFAAIEERAAADGFPIVLHGVQGNQGLTWGGQFSLVALARTGRFGAMLREAQAIALTERTALPRVLARELLMRAAPRSLQRLAMRLHGYDPDDVSRYSLLRRDALRALDLPGRWRENGFDPWYRIYGEGIAYRAHHIFDQNQLSRDFGAMLEGATGRQRRDPFADRELIEFCLSVPEWMYRRNGVGRSFARAVFADRLPPEILNDTRHGEQRANWFAALEVLRPHIEHEAGRIESSALAARLIDVPRLQALIAAWPADATEAQARMSEYRFAFTRAVRAGEFIRWVEGGNA